jgi:predicted hydrocarbon binding protein
MEKLIGKERLGSQTESLNRLLAVLGWGVVTLTGSLSHEPVSIQIEDCFECSLGKGIRKGCNFLRGYIAGAARVSFGGNPNPEEIRCRLRGAQFCEFRVAPPR